MNIKPAVNVPINSIYKNIEIIQNDMLILEGKDYNEMIKNLINYSKYAGKVTITYNQEKRKYYLKERDSKQSGDWDTLIGQSAEDINDCWVLLDMLFNIIKYTVINEVLVIYVK